MAHSALRELLVKSLSLRSPATRLELRERTGLSADALIAAIRSLTADRLVIVRPARTNAARAPGRPRLRVALLKPPGVIVGLHLTSNKVAAAVARTNGEILAERHLQIDLAQPDLALAATAIAIHDSLAESGTTPDAVLAGVPAHAALRIHDKSAGDALHAWIELDRRPQLAGLGENVLVVSDTHLGASAEHHLGASAEHHLGAARELQDFLCVSASDTVEAALMLDGKIYEGATGLAGAIGHTRVTGAPGRCVCGRRGCLNLVVCTAELHVLTTTHSLSTVGLASGFHALIS